MRNLLKAECIKLTKSLPLKIMMVAMFVFALVTSLSSLSYMNSPMRDELDIVFYGYDAFIISLRDTALSITLGIIVIGIVVCGDFDNRTIQAEIYAGHSRRNIVVSKFFAMFVGYTAVLFPYPLGRLVFQSIFYGFAESISAASILTLVSVFFVSILIGLAIASVGVLIAFAARKTVFSIAACIVLLLLGGNALLSFGLSIPALGAILDKTPIGLSKALFVANYAPADMVGAVMICAATILVMCLTTAFIFKKAELK